MDDPQKLFHSNEETAWAGEPTPRDIEVKQELIDGVFPNDQTNTDGTMDNERANEEIGDPGSVVGRGDSKAASQIDDVGTPATIHSEDNEVKDGVEEQLHDRKEDKIVDEPPKTMDEFNSQIGSHQASTPKHSQSVLSAHNRKQFRMMQEDPFDVKLVDDEDSEEEKEEDQLASLDSEEKDTERSESHETTDKTLIEENGTESEEKTMTLGVTLPPQDSDGEKENANPTEGNYLFEDDGEETARVKAKPTPQLLTPRRSGVSTMEARPLPKRLIEAEMKGREEMDKKRSAIEGTVGSFLAKNGQAGDFDMDFILKTHQADPTGMRKWQGMDALKGDLVIHHALKKYQDAVDSEKRLTPTGAAKAHADTKKVFEEVVQSKGLALAGLKGNLTQIQLSRIDFTRSARKPDIEAITNIEYSLVFGKMKMAEIQIRAVKKGTRFIVHDGVQRIEALRSLATQLEEKYPGAFLPWEEDNEIVDHRSCSQDNAEAEYQEQLKSRSQATPAKKHNPFSRVYAIVYSNIPHGFGADDVATYVSVASSKETPKTVEQSFVEMKAAISLTDAHKLEGKSIAEKAKVLKEYGITPTRQQQRAMTIDPESMDAVLDAMRKAGSDSKLNKSSFLGQAATAYETCKTTMVAAVQSLIDGKMTPDEFHEVILDHPKSAYYVLFGKGVPQDTANEMHKKLEPGKRTCTSIKKHLHSGRRLSQRAMSMKGYNVISILKELERDLNPCIAFTSAEIIEAPKNDGFDDDLCIVNLIDFEDLKTTPDIFTDLIQRDIPARLFVTWEDETQADGNKLKVLFNNKDLGVRECYLQGAFLRGTIKTDSVRGMLICGRKGLMWTQDKIKDNLEGFHIESNNIDNEELRRLMFDVQEVGGDACDTYKYNSLFIHSESSDITTIVANLALNRVHTSLTGEQLNRFKYALADVQEKLTQKGDTIEAKKKELKRKNGDDEDGQVKSKKGRKKTRGEYVE